MDKKTLEALNGSIKKWEGVARGDTMDLGRENCPLCEMFYDADGEEAGRRLCEGCPVKTKTGHSMCSGTPYGDWLENEPIFYEEKYNHTPVSLAAATAELEFLKSLLPAP